MWFQCVAIRGAERSGELVGGILEIAADALRGEVEATGIKLLGEVRNWILEYRVW